MGDKKPNDYQCLLTSPPTTVTETSSMPKSIPLRIASLLFLLGSTSRVAAAQHAPVGRIGVLVAIAADHGSGGPTTIVRRAGQVQGDIIVIPQSAASPERLAAAAAQLLVIMSQDGDRSAHDALFRVPETEVGPAAERPAAVHLLASIMTSPVTKVAGVGSARVGIVYLPNAVTRADQAAKGHWHMK